MKPYPVKLRYLAGRLIEGTQQILLSYILAAVLFRLGNMQLEGLLTFAGASSALLFGFTSLQYNRARAYPSGPTQRRSLVVAELALRATLSFVMGALITTVIFSFLAHSSYVPTPPEKYPTQALPVVCALASMPFIGYSFIAIVKATRMLVHGMFLAIDPNSLSRR